MKPEVDSPDVALNRLIIGYGLSQAIYVAAKLGIPDLLANGPRDGADLARQPTLMRIADSRTAPAGRQRDPCRGRAGSIRPGAHGRASAQRRRSVAAPVRDVDDGAGVPVMGAALACRNHGATGFPEGVWAAAVAIPGRPSGGRCRFRRRHGGSYQWQAQAVVEAYDFSASQNVVDVGGGHGALLAAILSTHAGARGVLFDRPPVLDGARAFLGAAGVVDRCSFVGGDFLESVPAGGDTYLLKWIVHDWDDAHATTILRNCRRAMGPSSKLLLFEGIIPGGTARRSMPRDCGTTC